MATDFDISTPVASTDEQRFSAMLAHLGTLFGFLPALLIWLGQRTRSRFVADQAREALNFQLTVFLGYVAAVVGRQFGLPFTGTAFWLLYFGSFAFGALAAVEANKGVLYRYPLALRFVR